MSRIVVEIKAEEGVIIPKYETAWSSGVDVRVHFNHVNYAEALARRKSVHTFIGVENGKVDRVCLRPGDRYLFPTGIRVAIPLGYEIQVRPRSGLALKKGLTVLNTPGTIDADYRGEIGVIIVNNSDDDITVENGERIAQLVLAQVPTIEWLQVDELSETARGEGGFNSTGTK